MPEGEGRVPEILDLTYPRAAQREKNRLKKRGQRRKMTDDEMIAVLEEIILDPKAYALARVTAIRTLWEWRRKEPEEGADRLRRALCRRVHRPPAGALAPLVARSDCRTALTCHLQRSRGKLLERPRIVRWLLRDLSQRRFEHLRPSLGVVKHQRQLVDVKVELVQLVDVQVGLVQLDGLSGELCPRYLGHPLPPS
jgi:hypothetical protein